MLHGQWEGGGGHVHEHGAGTFPAGQARDGSGIATQSVFSSLLMKGFLLQKSKEYVSIAKGGFMGKYGKTHSLKQ